MVNMRFCILIFFCAAFQSIDAQNLSGFWKGTFTMNGCFSVNNIELQMTVDGAIVSGDSYHYLDVNNYVKKKIIGDYDLSLKKLTVQEGLVTTYHIPYHCVICIKNFVLLYSKNGNQETLSGKWGGNVINTIADCGTGSIILTRVKESAFKAIPEIKVDTGEIRLDFYDNAVIDGDSISVLINKKLVLVHQLLTAKPITMYVRIDAQNPFQEIEMVAENEGSIPPNTALLIITAGTKRYQLFLSSSEKKSAMVRFVYENDAGLNKKL
jgi:hypothetical protein